MRRAASSPNRPKVRIRAWRHAFPDFHTTIETMIADGDWVAFHLRHEGTHEASFLDWLRPGCRSVSAVSAGHAPAGRDVAGSESAAAGASRPSWVRIPPSSLPTTETALLSDRPHHDRAAVSAAVRPCPAVPRRALSQSCRRAVYRHMLGAGAGS
ncbi:MAG: ester cyclase [Solirubrobacteraceae bacterium]